MITEIFFSFLKIGTFTLGGGYAMLPLIESEIVIKKKWLSPSQYADMLLLTQLVPGVIAVNCAFFVAKKISQNKNYSVPYTLACIFSAITASVLPSIIAIILLAIFYKEHKDNKYIIAIMKGVRPTVVALILYAVFNMFCKAIQTRHNALVYLIVISCVIAIIGLNINPILLIIFFAATILIIGFIKPIK